MPNNQYTVSNAELITGYLELQEFIQSCHVVMGMNNGQVLYYQPVCYNPKKSYEKLSRINDSELHSRILRRAANSVEKTWLMCLDLEDENIKDE